MRLSLLTFATLIAYNGWMTYLDQNVSGYTKAALVVSFAMILLDWVMEDKEPRWRSPR